MTDEFIPYEQALALKKLGFDEPCIAFYKDNDKLKAIDQLWGIPISGICKQLNYRVDDLVLAPTWRQAFKWFREIHGINFFLDYQYNDGVSYGFKWFKRNGDAGSCWEWSSPEEAELEGLKLMIKLVEIEKTLKN